MMHNGNVSDLISKGALFNALATAQDKGEIFSVIQNFQTVDALPVVHAEWVPFCDGWFSYFVCSNCGEKTFSTCMGKPRFNYCPMCGAKMDGEGVRNDK